MIKAKCYSLGEGEGQHFTPLARESFYETETSRVLKEQIYVKINIKISRYR